LDALYSVALLVSLVLGAEAVAVAGLDRLGVAWVRPLRLYLLSACLSAWVALAVSVGAHYGWGHAPGSPEAMSPFAFLSAHVAFVPAALLPAIALAVRAGHRADPS